MPNALNDLVLRYGPFAIRNRGLKNMVASIACIELKNVEELINI